MASRRSYSEADQERFAAQRRERVEQLHQQLADNMSRLDEAGAWQKWLSMASRFHRYSFNNVLLISLQKPEATLVAGYRAWQAMGHQVRKGERAITVLGPVTRRVEVLDPAGNPMRDAKGQQLWRRQMVGVKPVSVFDASQVDPPVETPPRPQLLTGQAPPGLWEALAGIVETQGYRLSRGECGGANGFTDYRGREVRVRADVDDAQAVKTLAHELGHVLLPPAPGESPVGPCRGLREVEAESVAYMVTAAHGLDSGQYTFTYVAGWASQASDGDISVAEIVAQSGARVIGAVDQILTRTMPAGDAETALVDHVAAEVGITDPLPVSATVPAERMWESVSPPSLDRRTDPHLPTAGRIPARGPGR